MDALNESQKLVVTHRGDDAGREVDIEPAVERRGGGPVDLLLQDYSVPNAVQNVRASNSTLVMTGVNGSTQTVSLTPGSYNATELAAELQDKMRAAMTEAGYAGAAVTNSTVTFDSVQLRFRVALSAQAVGDSMSFDWSDANTTSTQLLGGSVAAGAQAFPVAPGDVFPNIPSLAPLYLMAKLKGVEQQLEGEYVCANRVRSANVHRGIMIPMVVDKGVYARPGHEFVPGQSRVRLSEAPLVRLQVEFYFPDGEKADLQGADAFLTFEVQSVSRDPRKRRAA